MPPTLGLRIFDSTARDHPSAYLAGTQMDPALRPRKNHQLVTVSRIADLRAAAPGGLSRRRVTLQLGLCLTSLVWPLLATMKVEEREAFLALARPRAFTRNEVVCHEGDPADTLHLVESGHLAVRSGLATGVTATLTILSSGDYFGELALLRQDRRRTATVMALEPSRTLSVAAAAFDKLCVRNPHIERVLSALLADRVDALSRRLLETMYESLDRRVYRRLVELANAYGVDDGTAAIPLSQAHLADLVGAARPSVNQVLKRLADQNLVKLGRERIELVDVAALARRYPQ